MAAGNITEVSNFDANVYLIDIEDPVTGGLTGIANKQAIALANRTRWLYDNLNPLLGKVFASFNYSSLTVSSNSVVNIDNSSYNLAFPLASPFYTTPNDGVTRTYAISISAELVSFTENTPYAVILSAYTITAGPTLEQKVTTQTSRNSGGSLYMRRIVSLPPNTPIKAFCNHGATGANATLNNIGLVLQQI